MPAPFQIRIVTSQAPGASELLGAIDVAAWATARWWADQYQRGKDPPCCLKCAGVTYKPDAPSSWGATFRSGGELVAAKSASCGEVAGFTLGVLRAKAGIAGLDPFAVGVPDFNGSREIDGATVYHAVVRLPGGDVVDETKEMVADG